MTHAQKSHRHELKRAKRRRAVRLQREASEALADFLNPRRSRRFDCNGPQGPFCGTDNHAVKYPSVAEVRRTRDLEWIRQNGTQSQKKALKAEEGAR